MAPHREGEDRDYAYALHACQLGLEQATVPEISDPDALAEIATIKEAMKRPRSLSPDEKESVSKAIDDLADWFQMQE